MTTTDLFGFGDSRFDDITVTPTFCLFRDIHKGIRSELFAVTELAGRTDTSDPVACLAVSERIKQLYDFLELHAHHEDTAIGNRLEVHLPRLAERMEGDHHTLESQLDSIVDLAESLLDRGDDSRRRLMHRIYLDMATFTARYLPHQDMEERELMPQLQAAVGFDEVLAIHQEIVSSIPPQEMAASLAKMLPAMNIDDRCEMLLPMMATAPADIVEGVLGLAGSVLKPSDFEALMERLR